MSETTQSSQGSASAEWQWDRPPVSQSSPPRLAPQKVCSSPEKPLETTRSPGERLLHVLGPGTLIATKGKRRRSIALSMNGTAGCEPSQGPLQTPARRPARLIRLRYLPREPVAQLRLLRARTQQLDVESAFHFKRQQGQFRDSSQSRNQQIRGAVSKSHALRNSTDTSLTERDRLVSSSSDTQREGGHRCCKQRVHVKRSHHSIQLCSLRLLRVPAPCQPLEYRSRISPEDCEQPNGASGGCPVQSVRSAALAAQELHSELCNSELTGCGMPCHRQCVKVGDIRSQPASLQQQQVVKLPNVILSTPKNRQEASDQLFRGQLCPLSALPDPTPKRHQSALASDISTDQNVSLNASAGLSYKTHGLPYCKALKTLRSRRISLRPPQADLHYAVYVTSVAAMCASHTRHILSGEELQSSSAQVHVAPMSTSEQGYSSRCQYNTGAQDEMAQLRAAARAAAAAAAVNQRAKRGHEADGVNAPMVESDRSMYSNTAHITRQPQGSVPVPSADLLRQLAAAMNRAALVGLVCNTSNQTREGEDFMGVATEHRLA